MTLFESKYCVLSAYAWQNDRGLTFAQWVSILKSKSVLLRQLVSGTNEVVVGYRHAFTWFVYPDSSSEVKLHWR